MPKAKEHPFTVVIPCAGDPYLRATVEWILESESKARVIVVLDGDTPKLGMRDNRLGQVRPSAEQRGVGPCRDVGIAYSDTEFVVLMDSHTKGLPGWGQALVKPLTRRKRTITCAYCGVSHRDGHGGWTDRSYYYSGGRVRYQTEQGWPLEPGWMRTVEPGAELGCALGGTYALRKSRYNEIGVPWRRAWGWGTSEQTLCMVNWLMGGKTVLAGSWTDHIFYDRAERKPYRTPKLLKCGWIYNRLRLIDILPIPDAERDALTAAALAWSKTTGDRARAVEMLGSRNHDEAKDALAIATRTWNDWCRAWWPDLGDDRTPLVPTRTRGTQNANPVTQKRDSRVTVVIKRGGIDEVDGATRRIDTI